MPPHEFVTKDFLKAVLVEDKGLLDIKDVRWVNMPRYNEITVSKIMPEVRKIPEVMRYFPDLPRRS